MRSVVGRVVIVVGAILALVMLEAWLGANQPVTSSPVVEPRRVYAVIVYPDIKVWLYQDGTGEWSPRKDGE